MKRYCDIYGNYDLYQIINPLATNFISANGRHIHLRCYKLLSVHTDFQECCIFPLQVPCTHNFIMITCFVFSISSPRLDRSWINRSASHAVEIGSSANLQAAIYSLKRPTLGTPICSIKKTLWYTGMHVITCDFINYGLKATQTAPIFTRIILFLYKQKVLPSESF